jgi:hypothetical protein
LQIYVSWDPPHLMLVGFPAILLVVFGDSTLIPNMLKNSMLNI